MKIKIEAQKEFSMEKISKQLAIARDPSKTDKERAKARNFAMEMQAYNMRSLRGDFDTY